MSFDIFRQAAIVRFSELEMRPSGSAFVRTSGMPMDPMFSRRLSGGAEVLLNISSSPYHAGKRIWRERMLGARAGDNTVIVAYNNLVGGQDELVFDGDSMVFDQNGEVIARGRQFEEDLVIVDLDIESVFRVPAARSPQTAAGNECRPCPRRNFRSRGKCRRRDPMPPRTDVEPLPHCPKMRRSIRLSCLAPGITCARTDSVKSFWDLSGGIDSALTAVIAVDALGPENVTGVLMPSEFSSQGSVEDSEELGKNLGIALLTIPITDVFESYKNSLQYAFEGVEARRHGRKSSGSNPRQLPHVALEQIRMAGVEHRQQERDQYGLLHAVWRHGRWFCRS